MNNSMTIYDKIENPIEAVEQLGDMFATSGMFGVTKKEQGRILALTCLVEKRTPIEVARTYHIIEGKLSKRADAMLAEFQRNGGRVQWKKTSAEECVAIFSHPQYQPEGFEISVTLQQLQDCGVAMSSKGVLKDNYKKFPAQMLRARAISEGVRVVDPSIVAGMYTPEEVSDFDNKDKPTLELDPDGATTIKPVDGKTVEPVSPVEPEPKPEPAAPAPPDPKTAKGKTKPKAESKPKTKTDEPENKPNESMVLFMDIIKDDQAKAREWLEFHEYLKPGEPFETAASAVIAKAIKKPDAFKNAIKVWQNPKKEPAGK